MEHRIEVDFNTMNMDEDRRVSLPVHVAPDLLSFLHPGCRVVLYTPFELEVTAVMEYDREGDWWYGRPDWSTYRSLESEELRRFRESAYRHQELRALASSTAEEEILQRDAVVMWHNLTMDERESLRGIAQYAQYDEQPH